MIGNPFQNPYGQMLQKNISRIRGLENSGGVAPPSRPNIQMPRAQPRQQPRSPYQFNFGADPYQHGGNVETKVTY